MTRIPILEIAMKEPAATRTEPEAAHWRSLEELAGTPEFKDRLHREFPRHAAVWDESFDRRKFLTAAGASLGMAGLTACTKQPSDRQPACCHRQQGQSPIAHLTVLDDLCGLEAINDVIMGGTARQEKVSARRLREAPNRPSSITGCTPHHRRPWDRLR